MDTAGLLGVARHLDAAGYHGLMVSDHVIHPRDLTTPYPYSPHADGRPIWEPEASWPDPWVMVGAMAAVTTRLHFATNVYVAPMRPLAQVAKTVGTAAVLSGGRVVLGAGAGWMREEFAALGHDFDSRGRRLGEMVVALRELWKGGWVEFHGEHYDVGPVTIEPHPAAPVPIYLGGHSDAALRRAARLADGWLGMLYSWDDLAGHCARLRHHLAEAGREDSGIEIVAGIFARPSADLYARAEEELGLTATLCQPWLADEAVTSTLRAGGFPPPDAYRASIESFAAEVIAPGRP